MFERFVSAWNRNDASGCAAEFADHASLINPFGQEARGSAAIVGLYGEYLSTMLKGATTTCTTSHFREVGPLVLVDGTQSIDNTCAPHGTAMPPLVVHLSTLAQRAGDQWQILDARRMRSWRCRRADARDSTARGWARHEQRDVLLSRKAVSRRT